MPKIKEHEYKISGVFFVRKNVYDDREEASCEKIREEYDLGKALVGLLASVLVAVLAIVCAIVVFRPAATQNNTEWSQFESIKKSLEQHKAKLAAVQGDLKTAREQNSELRMTNSKIADEKDELNKNLTVLEGDIKSLSESLEAAKQREEKLQDENKTLSDKKDQLFKDLDDTKYKLGSCKNKNMDHEVRSMELLEEIEGLKKELKACK